MTVSAGIGRGKRGVPAQCLECGERFPSALAAARHMASAGHYRYPYKLSLGSPLKGRPAERLARIISGTSQRSIGWGLIRSVNPQLPTQGADIDQLIRLFRDTAPPDHPADATRDVRGIRAGQLALALPLGEERPNAVRQPGRCPCGAQLSRYADKRNTLCWACRQRELEGAAPILSAARQRQQALADARIKARNLRAPTRPEEVTMPTKIKLEQLQIALHPYGYRYVEDTDRGWSFALIGHPDAPRMNISTTAGGTEILKDCVRRARATRRRLGLPIMAAAEAPERPAEVHAAAANGTPPPASLGDAMTLLRQAIRGEVETEVLEDLQRLEGDLRDERLERAKAETALRLVQPQADRADELDQECTSLRSKLDHAERQVAKAMSALGAIKLAPRE